MGPSDGGGASAGYLVPTPVDYDSEEDRERNGWEWEAPSDTAASNHDCGLHEESLPAESGRRKAHVNEAAENDSTLGAEFQSDKAVIVEGYRPFSLENSCPVLVQAVPSRGLSFQLWPAAEALCRYLESAYGHISGRLQGLRVLELGAGTGLVGIFAARLGADVILTDLPGVLENLQANVALNQRKNQGLTGTPLQSDYPAVNRNPVLTEKHGVSGELETKRIPAAQKDSARIMERILQADGKEPGEGGEATCLATVEPTERFLKPETDVGKLRPVPECTLAGSTIGLTRDAETRSHRTPCEGQGEMLTDADCGRKNGRSGSGSEMKSERRNHRELAASLSVELLSWGMKEDVDALVKRTGGFDLVLASDVVYYDTLFEPLLQTLRWLTKPGVGEVPTACSDESQSSRHEGSENHARATVKTGSNGERAAVIMQNRALEAVTGKQKVLIAHLRRWKKDAKFFRKASKYFDVRLVYSHPPVGEARKGVEVFELVAKR